MLMSSAARQDEASHVADCSIAYALGIVQGHSVALLAYREAVLRCYR